MTKQIIVSFKITCEDKYEGFRVPTVTKTVQEWGPLRHAVLLDAYQAYCTKNPKGSKKQFAEQMVENIAAGEHPILMKNENDKDQTPFTAYAIMAQLDWMAQKENRVIVKTELGLEFYPNNLFTMTSFQKAEESKIANERKAAVATEDEPSEEEKNAVADSIASLLGFECNFGDGWFSPLSKEGQSKESKMDPKLLQGLARAIILGIIEKGAKIKEQQDSDENIL